MTLSAGNISSGSGSWTRVADLPYSFIVASDVGGHKELIEHGKTGILFKAGDCKALSEALLGLLNDRQRWPELKSNGRHFVEAVRNWRNSVANYVAPYQALTGKTGC